MTTDLTREENRNPSNTDKLYTEKPLTDEEASRPVVVNGVTMSFAHFLTYNKEGLSPFEIRKLRQMESGESYIIGGGGFAKYEIERVD